MPDDQTLLAVHGHALPHRGRITPELPVQRVLEGEAAQQAAADPGDLQRVAAETLLAGQPDGHRLEGLQERRAAELASAQPDPALQPGRVAGADLTQVHAGADVAGQGPEDAAEVDSLRSRVVHDGEASAVGEWIDVVGGNHLHPQSGLGDHLLGHCPDALAAGANRLVTAQVGGAGGPGADGQGVDVAGHVHGSPDAPGDLVAVSGGVEHPVPDGVVHASGVQVVQGAVLLEGHGHDLGHASG